MNEVEQYLRKLEWALRDLPEDERKDVAAEIRSHLEAGLDEAQEQDAENTAVSLQNLLAELGPPTELARNLQCFNWKRNVVNVALALIPLLLLNPINSLVHEWWGTTDKFVFIVTSLINVLICFVMIGWAKRRGSLLLKGWWLANFVGIVFFDFIFSLSGPYEYGFYWPLIIAVLLLGGIVFYGRFLWQNRINGVMMMLTLTPLLWGSIFDIAISALIWDANYEWNGLLTINMTAVALVLIACIGFLPFNRELQWLFFSLLCVICTAVNFILWWPNPNTVFWLLMPIPLMLGLGIEFAAYRTFRQKAVTN